MHTILEILFYLFGEYYILRLQHPRSTPPFQPLPACKNTSDDAQQLREEGDNVGPGPSDYGSGNIVWIYWGYRDFVGYNVVTLG